MWQEACKIICSIILEDSSGTFTSFIDQQEIINVLHFKFWAHKDSRYHIFRAMITVGMKFKTAFKIIQNKATESDEEG